MTSMFPKATPLGLVVLALLCGAALAAVLDMGVRLSTGGDAGIIRISLEVALVVGAFKYHEMLVGTDEELYGTVDGN